MDEYEKDLRRSLDDARKRLEQGLAAQDFLKKKEGRLVQDWINETISYELSRMTGKTPLDDRAYLEAHGAVRVLKAFNTMLESKASQVASTSEEVNVLNEQHKAVIDGQEPIKF